MIDRYMTAEMSKIWDLQNRTQKWLDVEIAVCEGLAKYGYIPTEAVTEIKAKAKFDLKRMAELEKETRHDVMAFVRNVAENVGPAGKYIHYGITSYDVVDTSLGLLMREATDLIIQRAEKLLDVIKKRAREEAETPMIGRTHGVHAEPITFGFKLAGWYAELQRDIARLTNARHMVAVGQISGAVGTHANIDPRVELYVCEKIGLTPDPASTQIVNRDRHAQLLCTLAITAASLERWSTEIRNLQRTEILEVQEAFAVGQTGSSAMPHKRNPWNAETVSGLARVVRGNALAMLETIASWHERDLTNSGAERIIIPDTCLLVDWMLAKFTNILENLQVNRSNMAENINKMRGLVFSEQIMLLLISKGLSREVAYKLAQRNAAKAWEGEEFKSALLNDSEVCSHLSPEEIEQAFDIKHHLKHVEKTLKSLGI
jgi:adenylosuccinate lyase